MNDLTYCQLSTPNRSLKLVLYMEEIIRNSFDISTTLVEDFIAPHSLSQSPQILRVDDLILTTQLSLRTSYCIQYSKFKRSRGQGFISHN